jgi:hypothetical protein
LLEGGISTLIISQLFSSALFFSFSKNSIKLCFYSFIYGKKLKKKGILQLLNHGVSDELARNTRKQVQEVFELPLTGKKRWKQKPGCLEGYGQAYVISEEQKLDWNDMIFLKALPIQDRKLEFWPEKPQKFRY